MANDRPGESLADLAAPIDTSDLTPPADAVAQPEPEPQPEPTPEPTAFDRLDKHPRFQEVIRDKNAFKEAAERERDRAARLEAELAQERAAKATPPSNGQPASVPGRYSPADLEAMVTAGTATQAQVIAYERDTAQLVARREAEAVFSANSQVQPIINTVNRYAELLPDVYRAGSENNQKAEREMAALLAMGFPRNKATELQAMRNAFGSVDALAAARRSKDITAHERDAYPEGGSGRSGKPASEAKHKSYVAALKDKRPGEYAEYAEMIRTGRYSGWAEVEAELKSAADNAYNPALQSQTRELLNA